MPGAPVVISEKYGIPVRPVDRDAPVLTVAENGLGTPIVITENGAPFIVEGLIPPWVNPDAVWASNFELGQYWRSGAGLLPATSVLTTTRASGINLPNTAGVYQTLGVNTLPRTDRGLYANGQVGALNENGNNPQSATGWSNTTATATNGPTIGGFFQSSYVASNGNAGGGRNAAGLSVESGKTYAIKAFFSAGLNDSGEISLLAQLAPGTISRITGVRGAATVVVQSAGTIVIVSQSATHIFALWTPNSTLTTALVRVGPNSDTATKDILLWGIDVTETAFVPTAWVSTSSPAPTLLASDIRAVQGIRPDTNPEPFPGWEAAGLDDAFGGKTIVTIDRLNAAEPRFITGAGVDADNITKLIFDTDNRFKLIVRKSGVDEVALQTGAVASTGDKIIEWQAKPGDYGIDATGVAGDTDSDAETLPTGATTLRIGSDFGALNPFNGWIKELQILKVAA